MYIKLIFLSAALMFSLINSALSSIEKNDSTEINDDNASFVFENETTFDDTFEASDNSDMSVSDSVLIDSIDLFIDKDRTESIRLESDNTISADPVSNTVKTNSNNSIIAKDIESTRSSSVIITPDESALFEGGSVDKFGSWVSKQISFPEDIAKKNISGKVIVKFIVDKTGTVTNVELVKGIDPVLDKLVLDAVASSPLWTPAKLKGKVVKNLLYLPVTFAIIGNQEK